MRVSAFRKARVFGFLAFALAAAALFSPQAKAIGFTANSAGVPVGIGYYAFDSFQIPYNGLTDVSFSATWISSAPDTSGSGIIYFVEPAIVFAIFSLDQLLSFGYKRAG